MYISYELLKKMNKIKNVKKDLFIRFKKVNNKSKTRLFMGVKTFKR